MTDPQGREPAALDLDVLEQRFTSEVDRDLLAQFGAHNLRAPLNLAEGRALLAEVRRLRHEGAARTDQHHEGIWKIDPETGECGCECVRCWQHDECVCIGCTCASHGHRLRGTVSEGKP